MGATCAADGAAIGLDPLNSRAVNPDSVWSYQAGSKNRLFGGMLQIDASVYRIDWKNVQTLLILPGCQQQIMLNLRFGGRFSVNQDNDADFSLFINNVTNSHPLLSLFHETLDSTWCRSGTFRPRTVGLTFTLRR